MSRTIEKTIFKFEELDASGKEKAREWWRSCEAQDDSYSEFVIQDAATIADIFGIDLRTRPVKLMGGGTRYDPCIYWSGFSSQGDGACFEGTYNYAKGFKKRLHKHAPLDKELHRIADALLAIQQGASYRLSASMKHTGRYQHSGCMFVDVDGPESGLSSNEEETVTQCMRDFADWIYRQLEAAYNWTMADEQVDESILANGYEFDEHGNIH